MSNCRKYDFASALPQVLYRYVQMVAGSIVACPSIVITSVLGMLATIVQGKFNVRVPTDKFFGSFIEPLSLFTICSAESSERKSTVFAHVKKPLDRIISDYNEKNSDALKRQSIQVKSLQKQIKALYRKFEDPHIPSLKKAELKMDIFSLENELSSLNERECRCFLQDTTASATASFLKNHPENSLTIADSEGGSLQAVMSDKRLRCMCLSGYSGEEISFERSTCESTHIKNPHISMCLLMQPAKLEKLVSNKNNWEEGLIARCLIFEAESFVGSRSSTVPLMNVKSVELWWANTLQRLFDFSAKNDAGALHTLEFSDEGIDALLWASDALERRMMLRDNYALRAWYGKMRGGVARVAAILHLIEYDDPTMHLIGYENVNRAFLLIQIVEENMLALYRQYFPDPTGVACEKIIRWLQREEGTITSFKLRDMYRELHIDPDDAKFACEQLMRDGILELMEVRERKPGRRATPIYYVMYSKLRQLGAF